MRVRCVRCDSVQNHRKLYRFNLPLLQNLVGVKWGQTWETSRTSKVNNSMWARRSRMFGLALDCFLVWSPSTNQNTPRLRKHKQSTEFLDVSLELLHTQIPVSQLWLCWTNEHKLLLFQESSEDPTAAFTVQTRLFVYHHTPGIKAGFFSVYLKSKHAVFLIRAKMQIYHHTSCLKRILKGGGGM